MGSPASHGVPQPPQGWQPCRGISGSFHRGIGGRLAMESVAAFVWNGWQLCRGISGRIHLESVAALPWNTQLPPQTASAVRIGVPPRDEAALRELG